MRFTVRRPASAEVSPCCHRPPGGDVTCSVDIGVARPCGASFALEHRLALAVFGSDVPAHRASLRRVRGRDLLDSTESLVLQPNGEQTPTAPENAPIQTALLRNRHTRVLDGASRTAGHRPHVKCFNPDRVKAPRDVSRSLFDPVLASISLPPLQRGDRTLGAGAPVGAALGAGQALLQHFQPFRLTRGEAGGVQQLPGRQGRRHRNSPVDAHHAAIVSTGNRVGYVGERYMPMASTVAGDAVGLQTLWKRPRQPEPHPPELGNPHPTEPAVQALDVMWLDCDLAESLVHTGFAPVRTAVASFEEVAYGLGEVPQRLLLNSLGASRQPIILGASRGQLSTLLVEARHAAAGLPVLMLLDGQVPHIPRVSRMLGQHRRLLNGRNQPVSRHARNIATTTDKLPKETE